MPSGRAGQAALSLGDVVKTVLPLTLSNRQKQGLGGASDLTYRVTVAAIWRRDRGGRGQSREAAPAGVAPF